MTLPFRPIDMGLVSLKGGSGALQPRLPLPNLITTQNMRHLCFDFFFGDKYEVDTRQQGKLVKPASLLAGVDIAS